MFRQLLVCGIGLILLASCDDAGKAKVDSAAPATAPSVTQSPQGQAGRSVIYLQSGVGLDFGREPLSDTRGMEDGNEYRLVTFLFDEKPTVIDESVRGILEKAGYERNVVPDSTVDFRVMYQIKGALKKDFGNFRYVIKDLNGQPKTQLMLSWYIY